MKVIRDNYTLTLGYVQCKKCKSVLKIKNTDIFNDFSQQKAYLCPVCSEVNAVKRENINLNARKFKVFV